MNAKLGWAQEVWRIGLLTLFAGLLGVVFDAVALFLVLALTAYILYNLYNLHRLMLWLGDPETQAIPIHSGPWGQIYARVAGISRRHTKREKRLSKLVNEYAASTAALPDAAVAIDSNGGILWFNEAASRLLGLQTAKDIGQPLLNLVRAPEMVGFLASQTTGQMLQMTAPGNSSRQLDIRVVPYGDGQRLILAQDITERLQHERMRKDFVANVSHELRTPLTVVSGFIENLRNGQADDLASFNRPLELMEQQTARMRQIVEDLLLLARLESASATNATDEVRVSEVLASVVEECASLRADGPVVKVEIKSSCRLRGDANQLRSAVSNLLVNAIKHTPAGGNVILRWENQAGQGVLRVIDDGEGIEKTHLPRLTERFYRVDAGRSREQGGTGLGLAIVKHILNNHEARLQIKSEKGLGSEFACVFPASRLDC